MKKFNMLMLVAIVALVGIPIVSALEITKYGEVVDYTPNGEKTAKYGNAIEGQTDDNYKTTTFYIDGKDLKVIDKDKNSIPNRKTDDATWFGIGIKESNEAQDNEIESACWVRPGKDACEPDSNAIKDGGEYYTLWIPFEASELKEAIENNGPENAIIEKIVKLYWGGSSDANNVQTVKVRLNAANVTLTIDDAPGEADKIAATAKFTEADREAAIAKYEENQKTPVETTKEPAEKNADTADINLGLLLSILAMSTLGLGYTFKKRFN